MKSVSSRVQGECCLGAKEMKPSFKQCQLFYHQKKLWHVWQKWYHYRAMCYLNWTTLHLTCYHYNSIMTLFFWFFSQESLPYSWLVLGWLFVCQHECVYCRDSGRWASSSIAPLPVPWWQALIKWTSALPCIISVTIQPANKIHARPMPRLPSQPTLQSRKQT